MSAIVTTPIAASLDPARQGDPFTPGTVLVRPVASEPGTVEVYYRGETTWHVLTPATTKTWAELLDGLNGDPLIIPNSSLSVSAVGRPGPVDDAEDRAKWTKARQSGNWRR